MFFRAGKEIILSMQLVDKDKCLETILSAFLELVLGLQRKQHRSQ